MRPTRVIVNMSKLDSNIKKLRNKASSKAEFMAVVKANGYGHGICEVAKQAIKSGASWLGVAIPEEGAILRAYGIRDKIFVLAETDKDQFELVIKNDLIQTIATVEAADALNSLAEKMNKKVKVHIKLDTGLGRIGVRSWKDLENIILKVKACKHLILDGVFTHFATADEADKDYTLKQIDSFNKALDGLRNRGLVVNYIHAANSAAILKYKESHYNLVRSGISIYGYPPWTRLDEDSIDLLPALQWETKVSYIKTLGDGESVSYGRNFIVSGERKIATLPVGYADGYKRQLSNKADVLINGQRAPVVGSICMDQIMIDVSALADVKLGDKVVLLGEQGKERISAVELASKCNTISYEILTSISDRVPRLYIR